MLFAPTSESKRRNVVARTVAVPQPHRELHPRMAGVVDLTSVGIPAFAARSSAAQLRRRFMGLQQTVGNQAVLRSLSRSVGLSGAGAGKLHGSAPAFSDQAAVPKKECSCGGSCPECKQEAMGAPTFIGDLDEGWPKLAPDAGTAAPGAAAGTPVELAKGGGGGGCTSICNRAYADSSLNDGGGGVICDGATKCACVFDVDPLRRGQCPGFDAIVQAHETRHLGDVDCNPTGGLHRPPFRDPSAATASECAHRRESIAEMDAILPKAAGICKTGMQSIRADLDTWVRANCP